MTNEDNNKIYSSMIVNEAEIFINWKRGFDLRKSFSFSYFIHQLELRAQCFER